MFKKLFAPLFLAVALVASVVVVPPAPAAASSSPTYTIHYSKSDVNKKASQLGWLSRSCVGASLTGAAWATQQEAVKRGVKPAPTVKTRTPWGTIALAVTCALDHFFVSGSSAAKIFGGAAAINGCVIQETWVHNSQYSWGKSTTKYHIDQNCDKRKDF